jgi:signal peptidase I
MGASARRPDRARREAVRFAGLARRLARRHARALGGARQEVEGGAAAVEAAAVGEDAQRLSAAVQALDALWRQHLLPRQKPLWRELGEAVAVAAAVALLVRGFVLDAFHVPSGSMEPTLVPGDLIFVQKAAYAVRVPFTHLRLVETGAPRRGDLVVFEAPRDPGNDYVKRVVGVPGDVVELREQVLYVNGVPQPRTPSGDYAHAEEPAGTGARTAIICQRYHEELARGALAPPEGDDAEGAAARWREAAAAGVARYDVLQCRRPRAGGREGPFQTVQPGNVFVLGDNRDLSADSRGLGGWQVPFGHIRGRAALVFWSWGEGGWAPHGGRGLRLERLFKPLAAR